MISRLNECLEQVVQVTPFSITKIDSILPTYCTITKNQLPPLQQIQHFRKDLIEDKYIPSPDLLSSFQSNVRKTMQFSTKGQNSKLKQLYGNQKVQRNAVSSITIHPNSNNPLLKPSLLIDEKQQTILEEVKDKRIVATLPFMEKSLFSNEIANLTSKQVHLDNTNSNKQQSSNSNKQSLQEWKKMREKLMKNLGP